MKKVLLFIALIVFTVSGSYGQDLWRSVNSADILAKDKVARDSEPRNFKTYALDLEALKNILAQAPSRSSNQPSQVIVSFPNPEGEMQKFRIYEASVMHPDLAARHPEIQSYVGKGIDNPSATIRFSTTLFGLHTMTFSGEGTSYIDPYTKDLTTYIVYKRSDLHTTKTYVCGVKDSDEILEEGNIGQEPLLRSNTSLFITYRLAMACTIEYAAFHINAAGVGSGTLAAKKAAVLAAMNVTMTRIDGVYERELSVTMVLVPNNEDIIFITSDEFDNENSPPAYPLLDQSQTVIDAVIGSANYDIGHTVSTGGGGVAQRPAVCSSGKARGITGLPSPVGDNYDIDFVAHEMGHQFGGSHTFNSDQENCAPPNRAASSSFEPGSGTTIMAYAGICAPHNVQPHSDDYFHARSLVEIQNVLNTSGSCGVTVPNNNTPPVVNPGGNYTIPFGTAFALTASATDAENDALTYCWEQYNNQFSTQPPVATSTIGPNFRSLPPSVSPKRYFPKFSDVLANNLTPTWEVVPNVARTMIFSVVVRDNGTPNGGQTQRETMNLTLANTGPFKVTSQNALVSWMQNSTQSVTWDVAGTDANGINTSLVNIKLSTDGGLTFPYILAENTPNDGTQEITVPDTTSQTCRIMIEAVGNVYYALNTTNFLIGYMLQPQCQTFTFNTPFALPDNASGYTVKTIAVSGIDRPIEDVNITINATHPNLQNLNMAVIKPGGSLSLIYNQQCAGSANMDMTFDAQGTALVCASPTVGNYIPPTGFNLNNYNNSSANGTWQFGFKDMVAGQTGTVNSIELEICYTAIVLGTEDFNFENFALYPNPNNGSFGIQFKSTTNNRISVAVHDMRGRKIFDKSYNNTGLFSQNIQLDNAQAGVYLVSVVDGDRKIVKRVIVK